MEVVSPTIGTEKDVACPSVRLSVSKFLFQIKMNRQKKSESGANIKSKV